MKPRKMLAAAIVVAGLVASSVGAENKLNVNTATEEQLMKLPSMTAARAKAIVNYRKNTGELIQLDELKLIPQVKPIYDEIKEKLVLE